MTTWFEAQPRRFLEELRAVDASDISLRLLYNPGWMGWEGQVEVDGVSRFLRLYYPRDFPSTPIWVTESRHFRPEEVLDDSATGHQLPDGILCLYTMGHGSRSWYPHYTVVDVIDRYREFRRLAEAGAHVPDRYSEDDVPPPVPGGVVLVAPAEVAQVFTVPRGVGTLEVRAASSGAFALVSRAHDRGSGVNLEARLVEWQQDCKSPSEHVWFRLPQERSRGEGLPDQAALLAALERALPQDLRQIAQQRQGAFVSGGHPENPSLWWIALDLDHSKVLGALPVEMLDLEDAVFTRVDGAMTGRRLLRDAHVAMVGLGSLGSTVALTLAKAGVSRFTLFDPDILRPENVCRHTGDLGDLFRPKVDVVAEQIHRRNPRAEVTAVQGSPWWDYTHAALVARDVLARTIEGGKTVVVQTTANDRVERALNQVLVGSGVPSIYGAVLGEGEHGRVFRVIPGSTPCYECVLYAQDRHPDHYPAFRNQRGRPMPAVGAYRQPGIPGIGVDVDQVALLTARLALQTLGETAGIDLGYPQASGDHYLWTGRGGWVFDGPLQTRVERYPRLEDCPVCGSGAGHRDLTEAERDAMSKLVRDLQEADRIHLGTVPHISGKECQ